MSEQRGRSRMGPWRMLDIMQASMPWRGGMLGGVARVPEYGPPDVPSGSGDPSLELPDSNIGTSEWQQAIARERARRVLRA